MNAIEQVVDEILKEANSFKIVDDGLKKVKEEKDSKRKKKLNRESNNRR